MSSPTEENYLKAIFLLQHQHNDGVSTSVLALQMRVQSPSVTNMIKKLASKKLIVHKKAQGCRLTKKGETIAVGIIRKHRLWEVFLVDKLGYDWSEVHELAEQLEHVSGEQLSNKLDAFLKYPKTDPHGDPIPDANGIMVASESIALSSVKVGGNGIFSGLTDYSAGFLKHLNDLQIKIGDKIHIAYKEPYDQSCTLLLKNQKKIIISHKVSNNILVQMV